MENFRRMFCIYGNYFLTLIVSGVLSCSVSRKVITRTTTKVNEKTWNSTFPAPTTQKWPNRSPSNFARVTTSLSPWKNFITIRLGVSDPPIREIIFSRLLFSFFSFVVTSDKLWQRTLHRVWRLIRPITSFRARMYLLGIPLMMLSIYGVKTP